MANFRNHYEDLKISRNASKAEIHSAYRTLAQKHHPDRNPGDRENAVKIMQLINVAYDVLSDPIRRQEHDDLIRRIESEQESRKRAARQKNNSKQGTPPLPPIILSPRPKRSNKFADFIFIFIFGAWFYFSHVNNEKATATSVPISQAQLSSKPDAQALSEGIENQREASVILDVITRHPELNENSPNYNERLVRLVKERKIFYIKQGYSLSDALQQAVFDYEVAAADTSSP